LPVDLSRVKLLPIEDDESSDYINANYMPGYNSRREFIAAQGPLPSTKDDFWRMIWEQNVPIIVMLTRLVEKGREKCSQYWPQDNEAVYYGDLQVSMRSESVLNNYTIRIFDIQLVSIQGQMKRMIKQFHFTSWNDYVVPETTEVMLNFIHVVRSHVRPNSKGPIVVHCSAGVGRSGTYICVDHLLQHIRDYDGINIFGMVLEMRQYRCSMVQTEYQYIYIHDCLRDALEKQQQEEDEE
ncbi:Receptor-type tyrosine-protein phosphatase beta, partial [Lamellibrachia satsuma]